ncbi:glycoside hydrolase superfamily [Suillus subaureus]|uniref:Glycoside hydrolase superfamily n=1 Tax=Suillus subaureus TaxID=48587 RepID=A0A9P7DY81_9AGAM|nr:glycoside hydrolase superfamily [Suillus subaureus]KAG1806095.1 glycoside hydrolase superfamily [Suillus subaureus]
MLPAFLLPLLALTNITASPLAAHSIAAPTWYAGWHATGGFPLSSVSWDKYNTLYYSFAETTQSVNSLSLSGSDGEMLPQFVSEAHAHGVEAHIAVGGWSGGTVVDFALQYKLDGIQFDWESPNDQGIGCNTISVHDTANFLAFLQELRQNPVAAKLTLSAASRLGRTAGMPVDKIVLGVASYGHSFSVPPCDAFVSDTKTLAAYPTFNASNQPLGDAWDNTGSVDVCGVYEGSGGTFNFWGLIDNGFLTKEGKPADGIHYRYDTCSQTPYVYNRTSQVMISFDNVQSFAAKGKYIKDTKLRGFSMWEAGGDYNDMLLDSIIDAFKCA